MGLIKKFFGKKQEQPLKAMTQELAIEIIQEYGAVMQNNSPQSGGVADISNLPYLKSQIKEALIIGLKLNDDPKMQEAFKIGYIKLADWQEGVGDTEVRLHFSNLDLNANPEEFAQSVLEQDAGNEKWRHVVQAERNALKEELINLGYWKEEVTRVLNEADQKPENQVEDKNIQTPDPFKNGLIAIANRLREANGLPEPKDIVDATAITLMHIIASVQGKSAHFPVEGHIEESDAVIDATFLCYVGSQLILHLRNEGIELSLNDVIARVGLAVFQFLDSERASAVIHKGIEQYKAIIKEGDTMKNIQKYTDTVSECVFEYVISKDERFLDAFSSLYMALFNAR